MDYSMPDSLSFTISQSLLKLMFIESVVPSNHLILYRPLLLLPSIFPSIRSFSNESDLCIRWPKYWIFSLEPSNEYSGLISFRIDLFDLLAVQGTLKSLLQHHSLKGSVFPCSACSSWSRSHICACYPYFLQHFLRVAAALPVCEFFGRNKIFLWFYFAKR